MANGNGSGNGGQILFRYYGNVLSIEQSGPETDGYLSASDWNRFNNAAIGTNPVDSVFGRIGAVVAQTGDYTLNQIGAPTANWTLNGLRIKADGSFQLWNPDQSKWHELKIGGLAGAEYIVIGAGES